LAEVGAERDEETGELLVDEDRIREIGAVDAESVSENRRLETVVGRKRANEKNVPFNAGDLLTQYETLIKIWPPNTLDIGVRRLTGTPIQQVITSRPRSGADLYAAIKTIHGQYEEAEYELKILDSARKEFRCTGRITMPDARPAAATAQQGQPMTQPYYPPGYPPGYPPPQQQQPPQQPPGYPPPYVQSPPQAQPAPVPQQPAPSFQPPPVVVQAPAGPDMNSMIDSMRQMFQMFQSMQPAPQPPPQQPPPAYVMPSPPPPPPPGADMPTMIAWMQQMFQIFQSMQSAAPAPVPAATAQATPPQPQAPNPSTMMGMMGMPPIQPPPGMLFVPGFGFVPVNQLVQAISGTVAAPPAPEPPPRGVYRGGGPHRPPYYPQESAPPPYDQRGAPSYDQRGGSSYPERGPSYGHAPPPPPARPLTPAEQLRESLGVVRSAVAAVEEFDSMLPGRGQHEPVAEPEEDDSPVRVIDTGPAKIVVNKSDGSTRLWETGMANMDKIFKWVGEQHEVIQKANADKRQRPQRQQLPPGYVEVQVGSDYRPPPVYVAVPVDPASIAQQEQQSSLPPLPAQMPPPISPPERRTWDAPTIPAEGEG